MNIKEALQAAIKYETRIRDAYRDAMQLAIDERTGLLLKALAKEEHGHLDYLRRAYATLTEKGKLDRFESELEKYWYEAEDSLVRVGETLESDEYKVLSVKVLQKILEVERETYSFYLQVSADLPGKQHSFFERFVKSEKRHMEKIQGRLQKVSNVVSYVPSKHT